MSSFRVTCLALATSVRDLQFTKTPGKENTAARDSGVRSLAVLHVKWSQSDTKKGLESTSQACSALAEG